MFNIIIRVSLSISLKKSLFYYKFSCHSIKDHIQWFWQTQQYQENHQEMSSIFEVVGTHQQKPCRTRLLFFILKRKLFSFKFLSE